MRARALSTLDDTHRIGFFVGPFVGAWAIGLWKLDGAYAVHAAASTLACLMLLRVRKIAHPTVETGHDNGSDDNGSTWSVVRTHLPVLRTLKLNIVILTAVRTSQQVVLPL